MCGQPPPSPCVVPLRNTPTRLTSQTAGPSSPHTLDRPSQGPTPTPTFGRPPQPHCPIRGPYGDGLPVGGVVQAVDTILVPWPQLQCAQVCPCSFFCGTTRGAILTPQPACSEAEGREQSSWAGGPPPPNVLAHGTQVPSARRRSQPPHLPWGGPSAGLRAGQRLSAPNRSPIPGHSPTAPGPHPQPLSGLEGGT